MTGEFKRQKRKYSKNGCVECKRRKVKCDESKPMCWQCAHLSKECVYKTKEFQFLVSGVEGGLKRHTDDKRSDGPFKKKRPKNNIKIDDDNDLNALLNDALVFANDLFSRMGDNGISSDSVVAPVFDKWEEIELALSNVERSELEYLKVFYEKVSYWLMPLAYSPDSNICNHILFHHLIRANQKNERNRERSFLQSSMVSISAKYMYNVHGNEKDNTVRRLFLKKALQQLYQEFESLSQESMGLAQIDSLNLCVLMLTLDSSTFGTQEWKYHLRGAKNLLLKHHYNHNDMENKTDTLTGTKNMDHMDTRLLHERTVALARNWFSAIAIVAYIAKDSHFFNESEMEEMLSMGSTEDSSTSVLLKDMGFITEDCQYNIFLGYSKEGLELLKVVMRSMDSDISKRGYGYDEDNDNFLRVCSLLQKSREFTFHANVYGRVSDEAVESLVYTNNSKDAASIVFYKQNAYSLYDTIQQVHLEVLFVKFLTKSVKLDESCTLVQNSCKRAWKMVEWMFSDCDLTVTEINAFIEKIELGEIQNYSTLKQKLTFDLVSRCIISPLQQDFRLMMFQTGMVLCAGKLTSFDPHSLRLVRCKILAYFLAMADNLGTESARTSMEYLIRKWCPNANRGVIASSLQSTPDNDALPFS